ncbi:IMPACT family protein [[Acholeplasma] multilocale]|uniref:IMPACT family protein n=1 Tax=[Acholeplasma] multilocale TaxID=264638 RepID=UPI0012EB6E0F|nr:YigZ family protein [[Acholeplasma] multilocale]
MKTISKSIFKNSFVIKKSEFITIATQISSKEELDSFLEEYSKTDARHNCYAYKIGVEQQSGGFNDDGEPSGTAGKPIFNVIEKNNLTNIVILVIRYFGGVKLGAGPLTRAYTTSASQLINEIELKDLQKNLRNQIRIWYPKHKRCWWLS